MSKISIEEVESVLLQNKLAPETVQAVVKQLATIVEETRADRSTTPKTKNEFTIILSDPNGELAGKDFTGWVVQIKTGEDVGTLLTRVGEAAKAYNNTTRAGKKNPIKTVGEAFMYVKRKFFKEKEVLVKTKEPVRVLVTNNQL